MTYTIEILLLFYAGVFVVGGTDNPTRVLGLIGVAFALIGFAQKLKFY